MPSLTIIYATDNKHNDTAIGIEQELKGSQVGKVRKGMPLEKGSCKGGRWVELESEGISRKHHQ